MNDTVYVGIRVPKKDVAFIREACKYRGENLSNFVRRAVKRELARLEYLTDAEKKALEVYQVVER